MGGGDEFSAVQGRKRVLGGKPDGVSANSALHWNFSRKGAKVKKCLNCHASLKPDETACFMCDTPVPQDTNKVTLQQRFRTGVKFGLFFCAGLTVLSLFTDLAPSFTKCLVATVVMSLVKSSADQMAQT